MKHRFKARLKAARLLFKTAAYIQRHGWTKGQFVNDKGQVCAIGALRITSGVATPESGGEIIYDAEHFGFGYDTSDRGNLYNVAQRELEQCVKADGRYDGCVVDWNDADEMTEGRVVKVIRDCAWRVLRGRKAKLPERVSGGLR